MCDVGVFGQHFDRVLPIYACTIECIIHSRRSAAIISFCDEIFGIIFFSIHHLNRLRCFTMAEQSHCAKSPTECVLMPLSWDAQRAKFFGQRALSTIVCSPRCVRVCVCVWQQVE